MRARALPLAILVAAVAWIAYLWWGHWEDAQPAVWVCTSVVLAGALAGVIVPAARARTHAAIAGVLMVVFSAFAASRAFGAWPFAWDALADGRYAGVMAIMGAVVGVGLCAGAFWARWIAIAFAAGDVLGGALNSFAMRTWRDETGWLAAIGVIGGAVILVQLLRPEVRAHFGRRAENAVWAQRDRLIASARWAAIANFAAATMLLLYALGQPVAPDTIASALVLAPILAIGSALVMMRRSAGIAVLAVGGLGLLVHVAASFSYAATWARPIVGYYAAFWLPAALLGLVAGAIAFARARR